MTRDAHATVDDDLPWEAPRGAAAGPRTQLFIAWSLEEPERIGESAEVTGPAILGRGDAAPEDDAPRLRFCQRRPGLVLPGPALSGARISRQQLRVEPAGNGRLRVSSLGRCRLFVNGVEATEAEVGDGDTLHLRNALLLLVVRRPAFGAPGTWSGRWRFPFGEADELGIVGESVASWRMREDLALAAGSGLHVLVHGPSGSGKELAARAIHKLSRRSGKPFIARNAATFTESLIDAELFGNIRNFPNVGTPERAGLVGEADGGSLFLDEIGELPSTMQAHLLRLLDHDGEYHRLGEAKARKADIRLLAATNRSLDQLKHDFAARLTARVALGGLDTRPEDVPLIARATLGRLADKSPELEVRFFERRHGRRAEARISPELIERLLRHPFTLHVRELERLLWVAVSSSQGDYIASTPALEEALGTSRPRPAAAPVEAVRVLESRPVVMPSRDEVIAALGATRGKVAGAASMLGLTSRYVLYRLMRQYGLAQPESEATSA